jgi:CxxC-x17-CxxC domain-containing protein
VAGYGVTRQIEPQLQAQALREQGVDIDVAFVNTNPEREGFEVSCGGCGRKAKLPFEPPPGKVALCPDCMRAGRTGQS